MSIDHITERPQRDPLPPGTAFDPWEERFSEDMRPAKLPEQTPLQQPDGHGE